MLTLMKADFKLFFKWRLVLMNVKLECLQCNFRLTKYFVPVKGG